jgi:hypothetical protein
MSMVSARSTMSIVFPSAARSRGRSRPRLSIDRISHACARAGFSVASSPMKSTCNTRRARSRGHSRGVCSRRGTGRGRSERLTKGRVGVRMRGDDRDRLGAQRCGVELAREAPLASLASLGCRPAPLRALRRRGSKATTVKLRSAASGIKLEHVPEHVRRGGADAGVTFDGRR